MTDAKDIHQIEIRVFGALRKHMDSQNLPYLVEKSINPGEVNPKEIAGELNLPPSEIEGVFVNGKIRDMDTPLSPGDRIAFLPYGTPGPYRVYLGIINKGKKEDQE